MSPSNYHNRKMEQIIISIILNELIKNLVKPIEKIQLEPEKLINAQRQRNINQAKIKIGLGLNLKILRKNKTQICNKRLKAFLNNK